MRTRRLSAVSVVAVTGAGLALVATAPSVAASPTTPVPYAHVEGSAKLAANLEASVAGYVATLPAAGRRAASATFTVPVVTCTRATQAPLFITFGLYGTAIGGDGGFDYATGELTITCTQGVAYYQAAAATNPDRAVGAVSPGDKLAVDLLATRARTSATLTDVTTGGVFRSSGNGIAATTAQASAQGGFEGQTFPRPAGIAFKAVKIDGAALGTYAPTAFDQVYDSRLLLQTTALTPNGLNFSVRFRSQP